MVFHLSLNWRLYFHFFEVQVIGTIDIGKIWLSLFFFLRFALKILLFFYRIFFIFCSVISIIVCTFIGFFSFFSAFVGGVIWSAFHTVRIVVTVITSMFVFSTVSMSPAIYWGGPSCLFGYSNHTIELSILNISLLFFLWASCLLKRGSGNLFTWCVYM